MDRVRLGRALGKGARGAARTAWEAIDAATTPSPTTPPTRTTRVPPEIQRPTYPKPPISQQPRRSTAETTYEVLGKSTGAIRGASRGIAGPLRNASRALWHELTGSFFALFAFSFVVGAWKWRTGIHGNAFEQRRFYFAAGLAALFLYFSISSFLRANRKPAQ